MVSTSAYRIKGHKWNLIFLIPALILLLMLCSETWSKGDCEADFDADGDVDGTDLAVFAEDFGRTDCAGGPPCEGDFDGDGDVDGTDLSVFAADFGRTDCPVIPPPPEDVDYGLNDDEQEGGGGLVGETVRLLNGNIVEVRSDLSFLSPNRLGLTFGTTYNSRSAETGILGFGWTHTYSATLDPDFEISGASYLKVLCPTGRAHYFQEETPGNYKGAFHERSHVKEEAGDYVWYRLNGSRYGFSTEGILVWIEDEKANRINVAYDAQDSVETVSDLSSGRVLTFGYNANGLLESITGPVTTAVSNGIWVTYGYDANQNLTAVSYADGSGFTYGYTDPEDIHNLTEKRNKANHQLNTWTYDTQDRCYNNFSVEGKGVSIDYVSETHVEVTDAYGTLRTYTLGEIDGRLRVTAIEGPAGAPYSDSNAIRLEYDASMRLIEVEYAEGTVNQYQDYDDRGNPTTVRLAVGTSEARVITYTYHPDINRPLTRSEASVLGSGDKVTIWDYDDDYNSIPNESPTGLLSRIVEQGYTRDASGAVVTYEYVTTITYNGRGQVLSVDGPLSGTDDTTSFGYDATTGDILSVTRPHIESTNFSVYDGAGQVGVVTDVNGQSTSYSYDGRGRITTITHDVDSSTMSFVYNTAGKLESHTDEDGVTRTFEYDTQYGRLSREMDPDGNYISYNYDTQGNRIEMTYHKPSGERTHRKRWSYQQPDIPGKLYKEINPNETFTEYDYDTAGNVSSITDPENHPTTYDYDAQNRLKTVTQPVSVVTGYEYDTHGNLKTVTDAEGHVTTYQYDDMERLASATSPDTGTVTYVYDEAGNLERKTDANGITVVYDHDLLNRLTFIDFPDDQDIIYTYDERTNGKGHLTGMTDASGSTTFDYDNRGRLFEKTSTINGHDCTLTHDFSLAKRLTSVIYPTGRNVTYTRNSTGKVEEVSTFYDTITTILMNNFPYLPFGPAASMDMGTGSAVNNVFDELYHMTIANPAGKTERFYTYDDNGNITNIDVTNNQSKNQSFTYDSLNRLLTASGIYGSISYTYDKVGNRLTRTVDGQTDTYLYITGTNKLHEITGSNPATFAYDANGNTTEIGGITLIYNQNNRLIRTEEDSSGLGEYTYNGLGQRAIKQAGGVTTLFFYDFNGNLVGESLSDGTVSSEYIYMGNSRLARVDSINNVIYYDCNDHLSTPQIITDENGVGVWEATYKPFGEAQVNSNSSIVNNFRLPGQYYDQETGLHYNYFRDYHSGIGRYVKPDPIRLEGGINLYAYCFNDPVNLVDPSGQFGVPGIVIGAASGALAGFAAGMQSGKLWAGIVGGTAGGIIGGAIGFAFPPASSVVGGMIGGAVAGASGGAVGGMVGKRLSDPNASNKEMFIATAKGAGIGLLTGSTAGGLGTAALGAGATALTSDLAGTMASTPIAMCLGVISFDSGLDTEDNIGSTIPDSLTYTPSIYKSSDTVARNDYVYIWIYSGGWACPPYQWAVSGRGFHFGSETGPTNGITNNDLEMLELWADSTACGTATLTVTDQCGNEAIGCVRSTSGKWSTMDFYGYGFGHVGYQTIIGGYRYFTKHSELCYCYYSVQACIDCVNTYSPLLTNPLTGVLPSRLYEHCANECLINYSKVTGVTPWYRDPWECQ